MFSVRQILKDNWDRYVQRHNPNKYQRQVVRAMLKCSKSSCNSRLCSSCGKRFTDSWANWIKDYLYDINHFHVLLTIPAILRPKLRKWKNLKILMDSSRDFLDQFLVITLEL